jgi:hypothetical protein|tara:strand:+ start:2506 stop:2877 length:372 start_codon:yes stop_codon:yes gene_type:complete
MPKVSTGDLVCMHRRKNKGIGIVLEKIEDMPKELNMEGTLESAMQVLSQITDYNEKRIFREALVKQSANPDAAAVFLMYNAQGWCKKPKYTFARVRWFKKPSAYESNIKEEENWCPEDWLKKL